MEFQVLFQDEHMVAIRKPSGILVHRTGISQDRVYVLQMLRNQLGRHVYPVHRLDRGTAGILLFALDASVARLLQAGWESAACVKTYLAIVRGWLPESGTIDAPLKKDGSGPPQPALTTYRCLAQAELPMPVDRYPTARYSMAEVRLHTGRMHQIRRHFAHLSHPVLGDFKRGDRHHNHAWADKYGLSALQLMAWRLQLVHPVTGEALAWEASPEPAMVEAMHILGLDFFRVTHPSRRP
ncbi:MAG: tRNA pseudouridine65 synthase [Bacteroidota bacterium]